jgi:DNA-binding SARP family transcriptional activator
MIRARTSRWGRFGSQLADGDDDDSDTDAPVSVVALGGPFIRVVGPRALPAVRAALVSRLRPHAEDGWGQLTVIVLARSGLEGLLPPVAPLPEALRVVATEEELVAEVQLAAMRAAREVDQADGGEPSSQGPLHAIEVYAPPFDRERAAGLEELRAAARSSSSHYFFRMVQVGGEGGLTITIGDDDRIGVLSGRAAGPPNRRAMTISVAEAGERLTRYAREPGAKPLTSVEPTWRAGRKDSASIARPRLAIGAGPVIDVLLLGPIDVRALGDEVRGPWRNKAKELLAFVAAHGGTVTISRAVEELMLETQFPNMDPEARREYLRKLASSLRTLLRTAARLPTGAEIVEWGNERIRLDRELVDADVWRFETALDQRTVEAVELYRGPFAAESDYPWAEGVRRSLHARALPLFAATIERDRASGDSARALTLAQRAVDLDPYDERLHQLVMDLLWDTGAGRHAVVLAYRRLEECLAEIGFDPNGESRSRLGLR